MDTIAYCAVLLDYVPTLANIYTTVNLSIMRLVDHLCSKVLCVNYAYRNLHSVLLLSVSYKSIRAYVYNRYHVCEGVYC